MDRFGVVFEVWRVKTRSTSSVNLIPDHDRYLGSTATLIQRRRSLPRRIGRLIHGGQLLAIEKLADKTKGHGNGTKSPRNPICWMRLAGGRGHG